MKIRKLKIFNLTNFLTSFQLFLLAIGDKILPPLERAAPGYSQSSQWVATPLVLTHFQPMCLYSVGIF